MPELKTVTVPRGYRGLHTVREEFVESLISRVRDRLATMGEMTLFEGKDAANKPRKSFVLNGLETGMEIASPPTVQTVAMRHNPNRKEVP